MRSAADLKGITVGVTAPDSLRNVFINHLLAKKGVAPEEFVFVGVAVGPTAVAAMNKGEIDAIAKLDPVVAKLEHDEDVVVLAHSRIEARMRAIFGGSNPAAVFSTKADFIENNLKTLQALV